MNLILALIVSWAGVIEARTVVTHGLPNFHKVSDKVYRGGRAEEGGIEYLKDSGFKTIINLENVDEFVDAEAGELKGTGIKQLKFPMEYRVEPDEAAINEILSVLQDPANFPIYLHCKHGKDRTGLVMALYRVEVQGWTPKRAYQEMYDLGFAKFWHKLDKYFRDRTGMVAAHAS